MNGLDCIVLLQKYTYNKQVYDCTDCFSTLFKIYIGTCGYIQQQVQGWAKLVSLGI